MKLLMIATGYLPYTFSENLCNGKLVLALERAGHHVDVISRVDEGPTYGSDWHEPWTKLKDSTTLITYPTGNRIQRIADVAYSGLRMGGAVPGVRWARRAYETALRMLRNGDYDALLTRSPNDTAHLIGHKLKLRFPGIKWIANWNDPADPIWPEPYTHRYSPSQLRRHMEATRRLLHAADVNTFPSESLYRHFAAHFPELESMPTRVIPHIGLIDDVYSGIHHANPASKRLTLLHSGNLSQERNPENTFKAMRALLDAGENGFEMHIMGHVNDFTNELIEKYGLADHVRCIGSFDYFGALKRMHDYDVLVLLEAMLDNGIFFASKFTDYAQTGRPILAISPAKGFAADMISANGGGILADNTSPESIADALGRLIALKRENRLSTLGSNTIYEHFSPATVVDLYTQLISTSN